MQNRKGFTLIELLIVVVIIGILAAIAIPKFAKTKDKAYVTAMKSDLKNLATAEEEYFSDQQHYTADVSTNGLGKYFTSTTNVTIVPATGSGWWTATATHSQLTGSTCGIGFGTANPTVSTAGEGEPVCTP